MIDVNQQRFWMLSEKKQFALEEQRELLEWNMSLNVLRFRSKRSVSDLPTDRNKAKTLADQPPLTFDAFDTWATVDETGNTIIAGGVFADSIKIFDLPDGEKVTDMAMNQDGILYVVSRDTHNTATIYLINRRGSKEEGKKDYKGYDDSNYDSEIVKTLRPEQGGQPDRIVALPRGGALVLDRDNKRFWQVVGEPLRDQPKALHRPDTPRPCFDSPEPQRLVERFDLQLPENYEIAAMASNPLGDVAVLLYPQEGDKTAEVVLIKNDGLSAPIPLLNAMAPFSIGWVKGRKWALLFENRKEAIVYSIPFLKTTPQEPITPSGRRYPLNWGVQEKYKNQKFCNGLSQPVRYQSSDRSGHFLLRPLHHLSFPAYATSAIIHAKNFFDSGQPGAIWHRLYLEAHLPKGTGVVVYLAAAEEENALDRNPGWMEHHFGAVKPKPDVPRASWIKDSSEVPYYPGLLHCRPMPDTAGVFMVLVQRPGYVVRSLKGRYLKVKIELIGNGHASPEVAAVRIYVPRFSYLDNYLPELYRETKFRKEAEDPGPATGSDFLQRLLCLFEGVLTPLEDKVAAAYMLTNPLSTPRDALDWLAQWVNLSLESGLSESQKRLFIQHATELYRKRGTMRGLELALNLATDSWVRRGDIVLLEDFRLRRTFASILGADLSVENDPLMMGEIPNANSFVGDTLILGEEQKKEFLALYSKDIPKSLAKQETIENFYARLANRLTVLVHQHTGEQEIGLIRRIVSMEIPAHLEFRIVSASKPLLIGLYSLVGVDTYLQEEPQHRFARVGHSFLGRYDFIKKLPVLDDRLEP